MRVLLPVSFALAFILGLVGFSINAAKQKTDEAGGKNKTTATRRFSESDREQRDGMPGVKEVWETLKDGQRQQVREFVEKINSTKKPQ